MIPGDRDYRADQRAKLLKFGAGSSTPAGFGYLDKFGQVDNSRPTELYITCRMTHTFSLGLLGNDHRLPEAPSKAALTDLVAHGVTSLLEGPLRDRRYGGWLSAIGEGGIDGTKAAYSHAFVILAAASAMAVNAWGAQELLEAALTTQDKYFWDEDAGLVVEQWDRDWSDLADYRGLNSNMHTVEAYLAAGDVLDDPVWYERAGRIVEHVVALAKDNDWRVPEHFHPDWTPDLDYNQDRPNDPFRPFGATVGHGLEWARLLMNVDKALREDAPRGLRDAAAQLAERAIADGWAVDGQEGFIYTTDWDGKPVVRSRMHWVLAEAICTGTLLAELLGSEDLQRRVERWWSYANRFVVDHHRGSWHHELDQDNQPSDETWPGKPDIYHAYQAALIADLPLAPSFAKAVLRRGKAL